MKKTYIEPTNTVVAINVRSNLMDPSIIKTSLPGGQSGPDVEESSSSASITSGDARESLNTWEEW